MKRSNLTIAFVAVAILIFSLSTVFAQESANVDWKAYSKSLVKAVKSSNEGVKFSAMQQIIRYADKVSVSPARYEVMDIFLTSNNRQVRRLALVTLYKINNSLDMGLLERQIKFEKDPVIKRQIAAILFETGRLQNANWSSDTRYAGLTMQ